nr:hypothetical protein [Prevotella sp.]
MAASRKLPFNNQNRKSVLLLAVALISFAHFLLISKKMISFAKNILVNKIYTAHDYKD